MQTLRSRPGRVEFSPGHPLARGLKFYAVVDSIGPADLVSGVRSAVPAGTLTTASGPLGTYPLLTSSGGFTFRGRGYNGNEPLAVTLFAVLLAGASPGTCHPVGTSGGTSGYAIEYGGAAFKLNMFGVANVGNLAVTATDWCAVCATRAADGTTTLYCWDYATGTLTSATANNTQSPAAGDGNATVNAVNPAAVSVAVAGFGDQPWAASDFVAFAQDPFAMARRRPPPLAFNPAAVAHKVPIHFFFPRAI